MTSLRSTVAAALCALSSAFPLSAQIVVRGGPVGGPAGAPAPKIERKIDEKAKAIYDRAVAETAKLESVRFVAQMRLEGGDAGMRAGLPDEMLAKSRYTIRFVRPEKSGENPGKKPGSATLPPNSMRIEVLDGPDAGRLTVLHGGRAVQLDAKARTVTRPGADAGEHGSMLVAMASSSCPSWFRGEMGPMRGAGAPPSDEPLVLEVVGTATIDDLECDLVKVVREVSFGVVEGPGDDGMREAKLPITETIAFARADGLPRQVRMSPPVFGGEDGGDGMPAMPSPVMTVSGLKANPTLGDAEFPTATPEGYTEVEFELPVFGGMAVGGGEGAMPEPPALAVKVGDAAPDFTLTGIDGKEVTLDSLKGKVVLLDFWATWCGPCVAAMPTIQRLHDEYQSKGVVVLGVNTWEQNSQAAKDFIAKKKFTYGCLLKGDELATAYGIGGIPTLVVIGKDGRIAEIEVGLADPSGAGLRKALDAALGVK